MMAGIFGLYTVALFAAYRGQSRAAHGWFFAALVASVAMYLHHADSTLNIDL